MKKTLGLVGAGALMSLGLITAPATAAPAADDVSAAALSCITSHGSTGGWAECTGSGEWRAKSQCNWEPDKSSAWVDQRGGTTRISAPDCTFGITGVVVELR
ncbi:hypothetical protein [Streptomyces sp. SM12]|uniref:hypothetical protein n=1 Tax=Streptomyces sp. SM12 TaxID=1071602 RepID=UPI000CD4F9B6|nr:hypothetical protein [Streptomyces sp. SM12]